MRIEQIIDERRLKEFSLIIPLLMDRGDIHSGASGQTTQKFLRGYQYRRFFGYLDMDPLFEDVAMGKKPLWEDDGACSIRKKPDVKKAFIDRVIGERLTLGEAAALCPGFAALYGVILRLLELTASTPQPVRPVIWFSGGGGFRVTFPGQPQVFWRRLVWDDKEASPLWMRHVLGPEVLLVPPLALPRDLAAELCEEGKFLDKNPFDQDKGIKHDLLAHFESGVWPCLVDTPQVLAGMRIQRDHEDKRLSAVIWAFWREALYNAPPLLECRPLVGANADLG